jgi:hypothetical protein
MLSETVHDILAGPLQNSYLEEIGQEASQHSNTEQSCQTCQTGESG